MLGRPCKQRFDAAVAAVADPAFKAAGGGLGFEPGAVANALNAAADHDLEDRLAHFVSPSTSALRAFISASRMTRLVSSDDARPLSVFGGVPSRRALRVS